MKISKKTKIITLSILGLLIIVLSFSYAYFKPILDTEKSTRVEVVAKTIDQLMFIQGEHLGLELNHLNFTQGSGNITGSTTTTAKLIANTKTSSATETYYVYFYIGKNEFDYSTPTNEPEIILTLKNPQGNNITSLSGLTYVTKPGVSGFDITNYQGLITVAENHSISTTSSTTGTEQDWQATITIRNLDANQNQLAGSELNAQFVLSSEEKIIFSFGDLILANNLGKSYVESKTSPNFNNVATTNEGMFATEDDYGTSYYFRGAVDNNWVKFANYYWRIVRINGEGSIKLIYSGTEPPTYEERIVKLEDLDVLIVCLANCSAGSLQGFGDPVYDNCLSSCYEPRTYIGESFFNTLSTKGEYMGYMYEVNKHRGHDKSSIVKEYIDDWYEINILNANYDDHLNDFIVCNDREFTADSWIPMGLPSTNKYSNVYKRLVTSSPKMPQLTCSNKENAYTKKDLKKGNGQLIYPIGLLTADEAVLAGGKYGEDNNSFYLQNAYLYWLVSPAYVNTTNANGFVLDDSGKLTANNIDKVSKFVGGGVRPVISLSPSVGVSGSGHWNDPYVVE